MPRNEPNTSFVTFLLIIAGRAHGDHYVVWLSYEFKLRVANVTFNYVSFKFLAD